MEKHSHLLASLQRYRIQDLMIRQSLPSWLLRCLFGLFLIPILASDLNATVTFDFQMGIARNSSGAAIADGTLWALLVDTNDNNAFTGFAAGSNLSSTASADMYFDPNQSLSLNQVINGDTIFAMGSFNGTGVSEITGLVTGTISGLAYGGANGTAEGRRFAFLWFPGATYTGGASESIGTQVGGINSTSNDALGGTNAMTLPTDGTSPVPPLGVASDDVAVGGSTPAANFYAVNLTVIPEPTSSLLALFGGLALLFRRRRHA